MKTMSGMVGLLACLGLLLAGCSQKALHSENATSALSESMVRSATQDSAPEVKPERTLIWRAYLTLEVGSVSKGLNQATAIAEQFKGYVEHKSESGEESASVRLRIPAATFREAVGAFGLLGEVSSRTVAAEDVTEQYVDIEARLKNKKELRDRLRQLLQKAKDVKDILAIETELNRVQSDIDAMEGKIRLLESRVDYAAVEVALRKKRILGPLGYLLKGLWWGIEKLFIIRG